MTPSDPSELLGEILARLNALEARLSRLEGSLLRPEPEASPAGQRAERRPKPDRPTPPPLPQPFSEARPSPAGRLPFETAVGLTWLNRIGVLTVVLGVAFFFKYAVDNRLIGEAGRVLLGIFTSFAAFALAELIWRRDHRIYAQGITGAGIAILYLSLYASAGFYHLIPELAAFALMGLATALAVAVSLRYDSIAIVFLGLIGGYLTPSLLSKDVSRPWTVSGYLLLLQIGGIVVVRRKQWRRIEPLVIAGTFLVFFYCGVEAHEFAGTVSILSFYALFWKFFHRRTLLAAQILAGGAALAIWPSPQPESLWLGLLLAAAGLVAGIRYSWPALLRTVFAVFWIYASVWTFGAGQHYPAWAMAAMTGGFALFLGYSLWDFTRKDLNGTPGRPPAGDSGDILDASLLFLVANGLLYFGQCYALLDRDFHPYLGFLAALLGCIHLFTAWQMWKQFDPQSEAASDFSSEAFRPILAAVGIAMAFFTLAIPIQFAGFQITVAWAIEAAAYTWISHRTRSALLGKIAWVLFGLVFLRLLALDASLYAPVAAHLILVNARFLAFLAAGISAWFGARWMAKELLPVGLYVAGHCAVLFGLLLEVSDWARERYSMGNPASVGTIAGSILLALYGIVLVSIGVNKHSQVDRVLGLVLLAVMVLKLYFYDVWQLQETFRIVAFVVLGLLLLSASFLYSRFRGALEKLWRSS